MDIRDLTEQVNHLPRSPGVYFFRDASGVPLYIGKASNLKSRVSAYPKTQDVRLGEMIRQAHTLTHQTTETDIEALILESILIKKHKPHFNIVMRDDRRYFYVAITDEEFPQFFLTHQLRNKKIKKKIKEFIGPFTDGVPLKTTLRFLRRLFPYCTCKQKHHVKCLNAHIGKCLGFCCLKEPVLPDTKQYQQNIKFIRGILSGKKALLVRQLKKDSPKIAERLDRVFENARIIRQQSSKSGVLEQMRQVLNLPATPVRIEGYDISNIQGVHPTGSMSVFTDGQPDKNEYRKFNIKSVVGSNDTAMLKELLARRFNHPEWPAPQLIIIDGGKSQLNAAQQTLIEKDQDIPLISLTKNDRHRGDHIYTNNQQETTNKKQLIPLRNLPEAVKNLILHIDSEAHRFAIAHYRWRHGRSLIK